MNTGSNIVASDFPPETEPRKSVASWYTPGHSDGLGDRLLMGVPFVGRGPAVQDVVAAFGDLRQALLHGLELVARVEPLTYRGVQTLDLRLQVGNRVFQRGR